MNVDNLPVISVIITYHNERDLVNRAVESVIHQDVNVTFEILLVDDASEFPPPLRDEYLTKVRVVRSDSPLYASGARNLGISESQGEYVCFLDADDTYNPGRLASHLAFLNVNHDLVFVAGRSKSFLNGIFEGNSNPPKEVVSSPDEDAVLPESVRHWICKWYPFLTSMVTVRREALLQTGGFDTSFQWGEEWDLWVRLSQLGPIGYVSHFGANYMQRDGSICSTTNPLKQESGARMFSNWRSNIPDLPQSLRAHLRHESAKWWLLAAQTHLEEMQQPVPALKCALRSLATQWSIWGTRSTIRAVLHCCLPYFVPSKRT